MKDRTSIALGRGEAAIVNVTIEKMAKVMTRALQRYEFIEITDVRDGRKLWINPSAIVLLQEHD